METSRKDMGYDISTKIDEHQETLIVEELEYPGQKSTEWTDEKHSLYLKSMEASFVDHLYGSLDLVGWHSQNDHSSRPKSSRQRHASPSGQYKVFQDGCWTKIDFRKDEHHPSKTNESSAVLASPWIKHYKAPGRHQMKVNSDHQGKATLVKLNQSLASDFDLCHKDCAGSITEEMGQNFVDEDMEEGKYSREHSTKRTKTSCGAGSPFRTSSITDDLADNILESTE